MDEDRRDATGPGRPRDPNIDRKVRATALSLLAAEGYARLTMEGVAARSGVGKASLYRRWPTKEALVLDALNNGRNQPALPDTGSLRGDMLAYLRVLVGYRKTQSRAISAVSGEVACNPHFGAAFRAAVLEPLRDALGTIIERAVKRGELPADTDVALLASVPPALLHQHLLLSGSFPGEQQVDRIVAQFFSPPGTAAGTAPDAPRQGGGAR